MPGRDLRGVPPGGWTHYNAERFQEERMDDIYRRANENNPGKYRIVLTKPSGSIITNDKEYQYGDAMREVAKEKLKELKLGPFAGVYSIEKI